MSILFVWTLVILCSLTSGGKIKGKDDYTVVAVKKCKWVTEMVDNCWTEYKEECSESWYDKQLQCQDVPKTLCKTEKKEREVCSHVSPPSPPLHPKLYNLIVEKKFENMGEKIKKLLLHFKSKNNIGKELKKLVKKFLFFSEEEDEESNAYIYPVQDPYPQQLHRKPPVKTYSRSKLHSVPEAEPYHSVPEPEHYHTVPEPEHYHSVPELEHYRSVPEQEQYHSIPEQEHYHSIPEQEHYHSIPESEHLHSKSIVGKKPALNAHTEVDPAHAYSELEPNPLYEEPMVKIEDLFVVRKRRSSDQEEAIPPSVTPLQNTLYKQLLNTDPEEAREAKVLKDTNISSLSYNGNIGAEVPESLKYASTARPSENNLGLGVDKSKGLSRLFKGLMKGSKEK